MLNLINRFVGRSGANLISLGTASLNRATLREISPLKYLMGVTCVLIVTLSLLEPASSAGLNLPSRTLFWSLHLIPATMFAWLISGWLFNTRVSRRVSPWVVLMIAGAMTGLLLAPISVTLEALLGILDTTETELRPLSFSAEVWLNELKGELHDVPLKTASLWPLMNAFVVWRISGMRDYGVGDSPDEIRLPDPYVTTRVETSPMVDEASTETRTEPDGTNANAKQSASRSENSGFLARLPTRLGQDIVFVEAQEHYLRVVTSRGEHLLLQGLTHAITELEENGFDGIQIHRSVWVAWKHVENVDVSTGAVSVCVSTGACWKISRRRAKAFLDAWRLRLT
jgi:hypothetical protein